MSDWWRKNALQNLVLVKGAGCRMFGVQTCENFVRTESQNWRIKLEGTSGGHLVQPPAPRQRQSRSCCSDVHMKSLSVCVNLLFRMRLRAKDFFLSDFFIIVLNLCGHNSSTVNWKDKSVFKLLDLRSLLDSCYWRYNDNDLLIYNNCLVFESRLEIPSKLSPDMS